MEISLKESDFLESFDLLWSKDLDKPKLFTEQYLKR